MKIALIGLPKSGKTTIFNALTRSEIVVDKYLPPADEENIGIVTVYDDRVQRISEIYDLKRTVYANIEFHDFPGIFGKPDDSPDPRLIASIKNSEAFALILRGFPDAELDSLHGEMDPLRDLESFTDEMILNDMVLVETRLESIELSYKRGVKTAAIQIEEKTLRMILTNLQENKAIRDLDLASEEEQAIRGLQFYSDKPVLVLLNVSEDDFTKHNEALEQIRARGFVAEAIAGSFEAELSLLEEDEAALFMEDLGIEGSIRDRVSMLAYSLMGLISFFTAGVKEVHAWTLRKGSNALAAAGKIHTDIARGFIRAECFNFTELDTHGSEKALREKGLFRLEGKEYIVQDGDLLRIRFNV
ncbi:MAG TPA: redox-regulated ATPase YchF [Candidatus Cloacimonetes bacterium]|nr:redox-regulated ATPase YchF [Candidatus Cloacimonadota bacterium]